MKYIKRLGGIVHYKDSHLRSFIKILLSIIFLLCSLGILGKVWLNSEINSIHRVPVGNLSPITSSKVGKNKTDSSYNVLLVISSSPPRTSDNSDNLIKLININTTNNAINQLLVPENLWVNFPKEMGGGSGELGAIRYDNPGMLVQTLKNNLNIAIAHYGSISISNSVPLIDSLGGLKIYFSSPMRDVSSNLHIPNSGCQNISGGTAVSVARSHSMEYLIKDTWVKDTSPIITNANNQDALLASLSKDFSNIGNNPINLINILRSEVGVVTLDSSWSFSDLMNLEKRFSTSQKKTFNSSVLPTDTFMSKDSNNAVKMSEPLAHISLLPFKNELLINKSNKKTQETLDQTNPQSISSC